MLLRVGTLFGSSVASGEGSSIAGPVLDWDDEADDATPDFTIDFDEDAVVAGNDVTMEIYSDSGLTVLVQTVTYTLQAADILAGTISLGGDPLTDGTFYVRTRVESSAWSNTETIVLSGIEELSGAILVVAA